MAAVYKSICFEADSLLLEITRLVEEQVSLKVTMENLMNDAFVDLAKARYIMGSTCVTKMQLPTENSNPIKPIATVTREEVGNHYVFQVKRSDELNSISKEYSTDALESKGEDFTEPEIIGEVSENAESERAFKKILQDDPKSLKKSKNAFCVDDNLYDGYNDELLDEMSTDSESSLVSVTDPIRLFGILVPNALKQAQVGFKKIVEMVGQCATVQSKIKEVLLKYNHLIRVKNLIEAAASKTKVNILMPRVYWTPSEVSSVSCISVKTMEEGEGEGEAREKSEDSQVSVTKSIRSVLFDMKDEAEENLSVWTHNSESLSDA